jgi:hypothetical protein
MIRHRVGVALTVLVSFTGIVVWLAASPSIAATSKAQPLIGTFKLTAGSCATATPTGSYFRMIYPGGSVANGKFFTNPDSLCPDKSYTTVAPGAQGGFATGKYQANPVPAFSATGAALANSIIQPQAFTAIDFSIATNKTDPQSGKTVPPVSITNKGGTLSGQTQAWSAAWNKLYFNQGSPKPGGAAPGLTKALSGTYDASTRAFVVTWSSQVVGGPFNGFTGYWHLSGTFVPAK